MPKQNGKTRLLLYGAYGYTGRLASELAASRKIDLVLAGGKPSHVRPANLAPRAFQDRGSYTTPYQSIGCAPLVQDRVA
ncbi:MAG: hypothetical protein ACJ763_20185 [Bdellovibrionia bacterium]